MRRTSKSYKNIEIWKLNTKFFIILRRPKHNYKRLTHENTAKNNVASCRVSFGDGM